MSSPARGRFPLKRVAHIAWVAVRALLSMVVVAVLVVVLCIDLPAVRRLAIGKVNEVLATTFAGRIVIENVNHLGYTGLEGARIHIVDPDGVQVILIDGVRVRISDSRRGQVVSVR